MREELKNSLPYLKEVCDQWGGKLIITSNPLNCNAPFDGQLGVDYEKKWIYMRDDYKVSYTFVSGVIHEMGHVFACKVPPGDVIDEMDFLGWEMAMAINTSLSLLHWCHHSGYSIGSYWYDKLKDGRELGYLTHEEVYKLACDQIVAAEELGIVKDGHPISVR